MDVPELSNGYRIDTTEREIRVAAHVARLLGELGIEPDHNTAETPQRVARMLVRETLAGCFTPMPDITAFPNITDLDDVFAVGPISVRSCCAHHLVPIQGQAWIGILPGARLMGLSKFHRLTAWVMARPIMQEEATGHIAGVIEEAIEPKGLAVVVRARHLCCTWRGVCDGDQLFTTSVMRGSFRTSEAARAEVLALFRSQGF